VLLDAFQDVGGFAKGIPQSHVKVFVVIPCGGLAIFQHLIQLPIGASQELVRGKDRQPDDVLPLVGHAFQASRNPLRHVRGGDRQLGNVLFNELVEGESLRLVQGLRLDKQVAERDHFLGA